MIASRVVSRAATTAVASSSRSVLFRRSTPMVLSSAKSATTPTRRLLSTTPTLHADGDVSSQPPPESNSTPEREMTSGESDIASLLTKRFKPAHLQVQDVSGGCGSFYAIVVASKDFVGVSTVKQHRMVNECLKDVIGGIHGLQLKTIPAE